jgi:putative PEP-CTERM system TPR-repeat lipoprotein
MRVTASSRKIVISIVLVCLVLGCQRKTKDQFYNEGLGQINKGNVSGAIVYFKNALEKDQNFFDARYQLAMAYTILGKYEQAEREFQKLSRQNPSRPGIMLGLARLYNSTGKADQAIREAGEYLELKPGDPAGLESLGTAYAIKRKLPEAEDCFLRALKSDPQRTSAKLELVRIYGSSGKEQQARLLLQEVIRSEPRNVQAYYVLAALETTSGNTEGALSAYRKISEINTKDPIAIYRIGVIQVDMGEPGKADKTADMLQKKFPKRSEGYRLKGIIHYQNRNYIAAIAELMTSINIQPSQESYYFLGLSLYGRGELENALSQFRRILDVNPSFVRARLLTSIILLRQGRLDDSIAEIDKVLATDQNNALAHNLLGNAYMAKGIYDDGIKELNRAIEIDPRIIDAYFKKGLLHLSRGKEDEAEADFRDAVRVAPGILSSRLILSSYYIRQGNSAKALSTLKEGLTGSKSDAVIYNNIAGIMFVERNPAEGLKCLQKAKAIDPQLAASYFNQATYHVASGEYEKGLNEYRTILRRNPKNVKAMLQQAALYELTGRDREAYAGYIGSVETGKPVAFLALANYHFRKKQTGNALSVLDDGMRLNPRNAAILEMKGKVCLAERKYKDALKAFDNLESISSERGLPLKIKTYVLMNDIPRAVEQARRMITFKPNSAYGYMMLASVYESRNDLGKAIDEVKNGLRADRDSVEAHLMLGNLYSRRNSNSEAMGAFKDALRINREYVPAYVAQGVLLEKMGKQKEAIRKYRDALAKSEYNIAALNNLAYLCADGYGSPREALQLIITAYKQDPGNPNILDTLGYALMKNGKKEDSRKALEKAAALLPNNPTVLYHLALSYREAGDRRQAAARLQRAIELGNFPEANQARIILAQLSETNADGRRR